MLPKCKKKTWRLALEKMMFRWKRKLPVEAAPQSLHQPPTILTTQITEHPQSDNMEPLAEEPVVSSPRASATRPLDSHVEAGPLTQEADDKSADCWICLGSCDSSSNAGSVDKCCGCPTMRAHRHCLAKWQLHRAGSRDETHCRFCNEELPKWTAGLEEEAQTLPLLCISHKGKLHEITPLPGPEGLQKFREEVANIMGVEPKMISLVFDCIDPFSGARLNLKGAETYDAALFCASVAVSRRRAQRSSGGTKHRSSIDFDPRMLPGARNAKAGEAHSLADVDLQQRPGSRL